MEDVWNYYIVWLLKFSWINMLLVLREKGIIVLYNVS